LFELLFTILLPGAAAQGLEASAAPASAGDVPIEEIQVTATRRPASSDSVTAAVSLIDAGEIRGQKLATDALAGQPGVFLQQTTPGQGAAIVRGLKGSEVLHLVDGLRMNNAIFRNAPTQYLALVSPASIERMEILRGSAASLYGSDAVGGVVQVVNRMPGFTGTDVSLRREFGAVLDSAEQQRSVFATLDVGNERLAGLVSANYLDTGDRRTGSGERTRPTAYTSRSFRGALSFTPTDKSRWLVDMQYGRQPKTPRVDELVAGFGETQAAAEEFFFAPNERSFVHLQHTRDNGWLGADWRVDLGWQQIVDDRISRNTGALERLLEDNSSDLYGASVTANGQYASGTWVAGVELYHDEVASRRRELNIASGNIEDVQSRFPDGSSVAQAATFVNADYNFGSRQTISGGVRFTDVNVDLPATALSPQAEVSLDDFSADAGWRFALTDSLQVLANVGYGFRAPNVFDLGTLGERPGNRFNVPNPELTSERITQVDLGLRYRGERLRADFVVWHFDYTDRITSVLTGEITPTGRDIVQTQNQASAELWGFESSARLELGEGLNAELVLNYTRGEQTEADGTTQPADRVPPLNGQLSLNYLWRGRWIIEPYLRFAAEQDRLSDRDRRDSRIDPTGTDGWVTANLQATWLADDRWSVRVAATNLLDERYRVHGSGLDAPGRNFVLDVRYLW